MSDDNNKKIIEHPSAALHRKITEQRKELDAMKIDIAVLRDLLQRTIKMLAMYEDAGSLKLPPGFVDKLKKPVVKKDE